MEKYFYLDFHKLHNMTNVFVKNLCFYRARFSIQSLFKTPPCPLKRQQENFPGVLASDSSHDYTVDRRSSASCTNHSPTPDLLGDSDSDSLSLMDKLAAPFTQQLLRYQGIPREGVAVDTFGEALRCIYCKCSHGEITTHEKERPCIAMSLFF